MLKFLQLDKLHSTVDTLYRLVGAQPNVSKQHKDAVKVRALAFRTALAAFDARTEPVHRGPTLDGSHAFHQRSHSGSKPSTFWPIPATAQRPSTDRAD